jgi:polyhydroxybutyrate depolymerase
MGSVFTRIVAAAAVAGAVLARPRGGGRGGGTPPPPLSRAGTHERSVVVDGRTRTYRVHVPAAALGRAAPVVLVLHGGGGDGDRIEASTRFTALADREGFVVVYPDGTGRTRLLTWNAGSCCGYARDNDVDDVAFLAGVLDAVAGEFGVDRDRVFATGLSNGAMLAYRLACERADLVAAIAPVAGALTVDPCEPSRPVSALIVHGTGDPNVPYQGGESGREGPGGPDRPYRSVPYAVSFWLRHNGCPSPVTDRRDGILVETTHAGCADGTEVVLDTILRGGHEWPTRPDITAEVWRFFARH